MGGPCAVHGCSYKSTRPPALPSSPLVLQEEFRDVLPPGAPLQLAVERLARLSPTAMDVYMSQATEQVRRGLRRGATMLSRLLCCENQRCTARIETWCTLAFHPHCG